METFVPLTSSVRALTMEHVCTPRVFVLSNRAFGICGMTYLFYVRRL